MPSRPSVRHVVDEQLAQWRAARSSRRDGEVEIIVIRQDTGHWEAMVVIASLLVGILLGVGWSWHLRSAAMPPAPPPPQSIVVAATATDMPTHAPIPSPTPPPTATLAPSPTPTATSTIVPTATLSPTPTRRPTLTPTPLPVAIITATALNVRAGPGVEYSIVGYAAQGQRYRIVGKSEDRGWLRIDFDGLDGWVSGRWVEAIGHPDRFRAAIFE